MRRPLLIVLALALAGCAEPRDSDRSDAAGRGLIEQCTSQARGATAFDDDLDGAIDEGCELHLGIASPLDELHRTSSPLLSPTLSEDKLRLYSVRASTSELVVAHRTSRDAPFGAPVPVGLWEGAGVHGAALTGDELEVVVGTADAPLARATRGSLEEQFGELEPITLTVSPPHLHPAISHDGRELFFVASDATPRFRVYRATREDRGAPFGAADAILTTEPTVHELTPSISEDGRTLYFSQDGVLARAERSGRGQPFGVPTLFGLLGVFPFESASTRELFFVTQRQPWSPVPDGTLWRAEICRDGPCRARPIPCEGGTLSADQQHCYVAIRTPLPWADAREDCEARGAHLATLSSIEELATLASLHPGIAQWLGATDAAPAVECNLGDEPEGCAFEWLTDEAWLYAPWAEGEPSGVDPSSEREDCLALDAASAMGDRACETPMPFVCESQRYLVW